MSILKFFSGIRDIKIGIWNHLSRRKQGSRVFFYKMELAEIKKDVEDLIKKFMLKEDVGDYDLNYEGQSEVGDNYAGEILFLQVVPKDGKKTYNLVAKTAKRSKNLNKYKPDTKMYQREVFMYGKVFTTYKELIEESGCDLTFNFVPKVYAMKEDEGKETMIFENLKSLGFKLHDRKLPWNLEHTLKTMEKYGEFHAYSMALRHQKPEKFLKLSNQMSDLAKEAGKNVDIKKSHTSIFKNMMESLKNRGRDDLVKKYDRFADDIEELFLLKVENEEDKLVFSHADCWNNNFMFQYLDGDESKPTSVCLLDFQYSNAGSPVKDLSYNIYTTLDQSCLRHFDKILKTYHDSLSRCLTKLGSNPKDVLTYEQLIDHWKKYAKFGLGTATYLLKVTLANEKEAMDFGELSKKSENIEDFKEGMNFKVENQEEFNRRLTDCFIHFGDTAL